METTTKSKKRYDLSVEVVTEEVKKNSHFRKRIEKALEGTSDGRRMFECSDGTGGACGSVWCLGVRGCRVKKQKRMVGSYRERVSKEGMTEAQGRTRFRHVSVLHDLVWMTKKKNGSYDFERCLKDIEASAEGMRLEVKKLARTLKERGFNIWGSGGIHLELIDYDEMMFWEMGNRKAKTILEWIAAREGMKKRGDRAMVVHFHILVDIEKMKEKDFDSILRERWNETSRQVYVQRTKTRIGRNKQTLDGSLVAIANYCFNGSNKRLMFEKFWGAGETVLEDAEEIDAKGRTVSYFNVVGEREDCEMLSESDIKLLVLAHNRVASDSHRKLVIGIH